MKKPHEDENPSEKQELKENGSNDTKEKADAEKSIEKDEMFNKINEEHKDEIIKKYIKLIHENEEYQKAFQSKEIECGDLTDKYKRTLAEMENLRKRTAAEKQDSLKYANFSIINDFITVLDDFQRAIDTAKKDEKTELKNFVEGIELIEKQYVDLLFKKYGTQPIGEKGEKFNPSTHQAIMMEEGDYEDETVIEVFRKGYILHDRIVRHAQVKVGKPKN